MRLKGSLTIEACLVLPVILLVITTIIEISIYLHDSIFLQSIADEIVFGVHPLHQHQMNKMMDIKVVNVNADSNEQTIESAIKKKAEGALLSTNARNLNIYYEKTTGIAYQSVKVIIEGEQEKSFGLLKGLFQINVTSEMKQYDTLAAIRIIDGIDDATSQITVTKELKDYYYTWLEKMKKILADHS